MMRRAVSERERKREFERVNSHRLEQTVKDCAESANGGKRRRHKVKQVRTTMDLAAKIFTVKHTDKRRVSHGMKIPIGHGPKKEKAKGRKVIFFLFS
jgi:hypothetical protein